MTVSGGQHAGGGAGIRHDGGDLTVEDCVLTGNTSSTSGGAIANFFGASLTVSRCVIEGNSGGIGAGMFVNAGIVTVLDSTISANAGGGIWNLAGDLSVTGSTINGNVVHSNDGGAGLLTTSGTSVIVNSTIAGNTAPSGEDCAGPGPVLSMGFNITDLITGCPSDGPGDRRINGDLFINVLGPLGDNGGLTQTYHPLSSSPALHMGDPTGCKGADGVVLAVDQRGSIRPVGPSCDVGAVESSEPLSPPLGGTAAGMEVFIVACRNWNVGSEVHFRGENSWDCAAAGLSTSPGDRILQLIQGTSDGGPVGGTTFGIASAHIRVYCANITTGQVIGYDDLDGRSYDCSGAGLAASASDRLRVRIVGIAE